MAILRMFEVSLTPVTITENNGICGIKMNLGLSLMNEGPRCTIGAETTDDLLAHIKVFAAKHEVRNERSSR